MIDDALPPFRALPSAGEGGLPPARRVRIMMLACLIVGYAALGMWPQTMAFFGVGHKGQWFRDARTVLAGSDAARLGIDTTSANPLDSDGAFYDYPRWWYASAWLGITREDSTVVGLFLVATFFAALIALLRPASWWEAVGALAVAGSPPFWLGFNRGNPDLFLFALLVPAVPLLLASRRVNSGLSTALVALATGLKFYPALAAIIFLEASRPRRTWLLRLAFNVIVFGVLAWLLTPDARRFQAQGWLPHGLFTFGAAALPMTYGAAAGPAIRFGLMAGALIGLGALRWFPLRGWMANPAGAREKLWFALGATLLAGCFFAVINFQYRFVFGLLLLPLAWSAIRSDDTPAFALTLLRLVLVLLLLLCWLDGLACAFVNVAGAALDPLAAVALRRNVALASGVVAWIWVCVLMVFATDFVRGSLLRVARPALTSASSPMGDR